MRRKKILLLLIGLYWGLAFSLKAQQIRISDIASAGSMDVYLNGKVVTFSYYEYAIGDAVFLGDTGGPHADSTNMTIFGGSPRKKFSHPNGHFKDYLIIELRASERVVVDSMFSIGEIDGSTHEVAGILGEDSGTVVFPTYQNVGSNLIARSKRIIDNGGILPVASGDYVPVYENISNASYPANDLQGYVTTNLADSVTSIYFFVTLHGSNLSNGGQQQVVIGGLFDSPSLLPVEMVSFTATTDGEAVILYWVTASEVSNKKFEVLKSSDAVNFEKIGEIAGNGTTNETHRYTFEDLDVEAGVVNYYQLKQIDFGGDYEYSKIVSAQISGNNYGKEILAYPNPTAGEVRLKNLNIDDVMEISVVDIRGNSVPTDCHITEAKLSLGDVPPGTYYLMIQMKSGKINRLPVVKL